MRYAAAEEDKKHPLVKDEWTKKRMGHSKDSNMKERYADTKGRRTEVDDEKIQLGIDITTENAEGITLQFKEVGGSLFYRPNFLEKLDDVPEIKEEFTKVAELVTLCLEKNDRDAMNTLKGFIRPTTLKDIKEIPFGLNIQFPRDCLGNLAEKLAETTATLKEYFKDIPLPNDIQLPEISMFPEVTYGNWRGLLNIQKKEIEDTEEIPYQEPVKRPKLSTEDTQQRWCFEDISKGNYVVLRGAHRDKYSLELPSGKWVWFAEATTDFNRVFSGKFFCNKAKNITHELKLDTKVQKVTIELSDIVMIYEDLNLTKDDIDEIENILAK
jgi:hypothetical protein